MGAGMQKNSKIVCLVLKLLIMVIPAVGPLSTNQVLSKTLGAHPAGHS